MATYQELRDQVVRRGRLYPASLADRWLGAVASVLADWGGDAARRILTGALPVEVFRGSGTSGRSWKAAVEECGSEGARSALTEEVARRSGELDPVKVGLSVRLIVGLFKQSLSPEQAETLAASLPEPVAQVVRETRAEPPWQFHLIPQSYKRPAKVGPGHHH
jgi:hypothetical protein